MVTDAETAIGNPHGIWIEIAGSIMTGGLTIEEMTIETIGVTTTGATAEMIRTTYARIIMATITADGKESVGC